MAIKVFQVTRKGSGVSDAFVTLENYSTVKSILGMSSKEMLFNAVDKAAVAMESQAVQNIQERIYDKPPSPNYRRTGSARDGRRIEVVRADARRVKFDSRIKGQKSENYSPMLNKNSRFDKFNTHFFDDAVKSIKDKASEFIRDAYVAELRSKLKG